MWEKYISLVMKPDEKQDRISNSFGTPAARHILDSQGLMRERLPEQLTRLLPLLCEHSQRVQGALCYSSFCWSLVQKSKWKKAALFKCRGIVQKTNGKLSNERTGLIMALLTLLK